MLIVTGCPKGHEVRPTRSPEMFNCPHCGVCYGKGETKPLLIHDRNANELSQNIDTQS